MSIWYWYRYRIFSVPVPTFWHCGTEKIRYRYPLFGIVSVPTLPVYTCNSGIGIYSGIDKHFRINSA
ncbi:hypothetical protein HanHA89_Chr04g0163091 [Helianthus annuus]|nr:hypothetical protein HanHA89_Chr04g0163091 [Helianthus annuus]